MRKICIVVASRANFSRIRNVARIIDQDDSCELQLVVGGSALLYEYGKVQDIISSEFSIAARPSFVISGNTPSEMAKSTGLAIIELTTIFDALKPDIVLTVADRYETMATAISASYMNIPLAHTQGGEITGSIDESVRHAITKLAHIHYPCTDQAAARLFQMGESKESVFLTGCPSIDIAQEALNSFDPTLDLFHKYGGSGASLSWDDDFLVVLQHPVTTHYLSSAEEIQHTIDAVVKSDMPVCWLWPNVDAGSDAISKRLRELKAHNHKIRFFRNFAPVDFLHLLLKSSMLVGNSSVGIRECSYLGVKAVNIGDRQSNRERGPNVIDVAPNSSEILDAIKLQINLPQPNRVKIYGNGNSSALIAQSLINDRPSIFKTFTDV